MRKICKRIILEIMIILAVILVVIFFFPIGFHLLWPFVIGWIIALVANPLVRFFENKLKIKRKHGSIIITILVLGIMFAIIYALIFGVITLAGILIDELPQMYKNVETTLLAIVDVINSKEFFNASVNLEMLIDFIISKLKTIIELITNYSVSFASNLITNAPSVIMGIVFVIMSSFFFIKDKDKIDKWFFEKTSKLNNDKLKILKESCTVTLKNYLKAQIKISGYIFALLLVGFLILGFDYAFFIALATALLDFLPVFGAGAVLWPWIIVSFLMGEYFNGIGLAFIYILSLILRQTIQPKIISDCMDLNPLASLVLMYVGFQLFGVLGLIVSVPLGMIFLDLYQKGMFDTMINDFKALYLAGKNHFSNI